jgi:formylglycine-generating enzyme required for sulfatase activity
LQEAEEEAKQQALALAKQKEEEETKRQALALAKQKEQAEAKRQALALAKQKEEEEAKRQALALAKQKEEEAKRLKKAEDYYNGGIYHLKNGNYARSVADFEEAKHYGHSDAVRMLNKALADQKEAEKNQISIDGRVTIELVNIPTGSFMMGSDLSSEEQPIHLVNVKAFRMSKYPITQKQYLAVMGDNPSCFKDDENYPVDRVSWFNAVDFCQKLSQMTGQTVRLPSEAEWEYACQAKSNSKYCFGDNVSKLFTYAWCNQNAGSRTHPVGEKLANSWGLHDMHGNVWEWCEDIWHENYNGAPVDGSAWLTGGYKDRRALRGGSWYSYDFGCRSANRGRNLAGDRYDGSGFRVVV